MMIRVYSHPRSGTNYLMALIARNLYSEDMSTPPGVIGHWQKRTPGANPYGRLAGGHMFYQGQEIGKAIYIYRDGRDVALSVWRTKVMLPLDQQDVTLAQFLRQPIDWVGTPGSKAARTRTIMEHWRDHLASWRKSDALLLRFEDAKGSPRNAIEQIAARFGLQMNDRLNYVDEPVGWYPNEGRAGTWRKHFTRSDLAYCYTVAPPDFFGWWQEGS